MKIGIMAYRQMPYISANTAIAYTIGNQMAAQGHNVIYIGYKQDKLQNEIDSYDGNKIRYFNKTPKNSPDVLRKIAVKLLGDKYRLREEITTLKTIVAEEELDCIICIFAPLEDAFIAHYARLDIPVILYQLDPFYNSMDIENPKYKEMFKRIVKNAKYLFTTDLLFDEYRADNMFKPLLDKISVLQFPKLIKPTLSDASVDNGKIRLLYAGSLYKKIRSPKILLNLKRCLPENCELVFCGNCDDKDDMTMLEDSGIICLGYCSQEVLAQENQKADVLINIGNLVKNQLGSKIIDYIATGKPILNITQLEHCPTLRALDNYLYKCSVQSDDLEKESTKAQINEFLQTKNKMKWDDIYQRYIEYTPEFVANKILNVITNKEM